MKIMYGTGLSSSVIIAIAYWFVFWEGNTGATFLTLSILQHGVTALIFLVEYVINLNQLKYKYSIFPLIIGFIYISMSVIHWATDSGTEIGPDTAIYTAIDLDNDPAYGAFLYFIIAVVIVSTNLLFTALDIWIMKNFDDEKIDTNPNSKNITLDEESDDSERAELIDI